MSVYWEKQGNDLLCGVHCLNSLLQGPFFNEVDLGLIAQELDQYEKNILKQGGMDSKDFLEFVAGESPNVGDAGNYSIQVLEKSISKYNLKIKSVSSQELQKQDLSNQTGFICHHSQHWYSIRKVDGVWYNLNSLYKQGPKSISDFYLSALLTYFQEQGQTIFLVQGDFPYSKKLIDKKGQEDHQKLLIADQIQPYQQGKNSSVKKQDNNDDFTDVFDSNGKRYNTRKQNISYRGMDIEMDDNLYDSDFEVDRDDEFEMKIEKQKYQKMNNGNGKQNKQDDIPKNAYVQSNNKNTNIEQLTITIWFNSQIKYVDKFHPFHAVEDLHDFVKSKDSKYKGKRFVLFTNNPSRQYFNNKQQTLQEAGIFSGQVLHLKEQ